MKTKHEYFTVCRVLMMGVLLFGQMPPVFAEEFLSLDFFQEEALVLTASRRPEKLEEAPVTVEVITRREIEGSGATNLWDLLRFKTGMDVIEGRSMEGNRALVSVRGWPQEFVPDVLVLVDGRSVYSANTGGVFWEQIPVQIQDIDRIEIIRGPNAALYGSNAVRGVINILTRAPKEKQRTSFATSGGSRGLLRAASSVERSGDVYGLRLSHTYKAHDGFPTAGAASGNDFLLSNKLNLRGRWDAGEHTTVDLLTGSSWETAGVANVNNFQVETRTSYQQLRLTQALGDNHEVELGGSAKDRVAHRGGAVADAWDLREYQYDVEALLRASYLEKKLKMVVGASHRYSVIDSAQFYAGRPWQLNRIKRGFIQPHLRLTTMLSLAAGFSLEDSDTGQTQNAYQSSLLFAPSPGQGFRFSYSKAPNIPTLFRRQSNYQASATTLLEGNPNLRAKTMHSYETGYRGEWLDKNLHTEAVFFHMYIQNLTAGFVKSASFFPTTQITISQDNRNNLTGRGVEASVKYRMGRHHTYLNYTYINIDDGLGDTKITRSTPEHKLNLGGMAELPRQFSLTANLGYKDGHLLESSTRSATLVVPAFWRLDLRLGMRPSEGVELFIAGTNVLQRRHKEFADSLEVPRTVHGGVTVAF